MSSKKEPKANNILPFPQKNTSKSLRLLNYATRVLNQGNPLIVWKIFNGTNSYFYARKYSQDDPTNEWLYSDNINDLRAMVREQGAKTRNELISRSENEPPNLLEIWF